MTEPSDAAERKRAITGIDETLLVEASAGTGKTALMAARIVYMLAENIAPSSIAAITYTEAAASSLAERVHRYIEEVLRDDPPKPLQAVLETPLPDHQRRNLIAANARRDELTVTTIHAFCRTIISSYAVEAAIDPGARMLDGEQADAVFRGVFDRWLKRRLDGSATPADPIAVLSRDDPRTTAGTLFDLAECRYQHRTAKLVAPDLSGRPDINLVDAVGEFRRWLSTVTFEPETEALLCDLEQLANHFADSFATTPDFARLWALAHPMRVAAMRKGEFELRPPKLKSAWNRAAGGDGDALQEEMCRHFDEVNECYKTILGRVATTVLARLFGELDEVLTEYERFKDDAALLDFDALISKALTLVRTKESVRVELGHRYAHVLVDEFQDTDPVQSEILFLIAAETRTPLWSDHELRPGSLFLVGDPKQSIFGFRGADIVCYEAARDAIARRWPQNIIHITANFRSRPKIIEYVNGCFDAPLKRPGQPGYVPLSPTLSAAVHGFPEVARVVVDDALDTKANDLRNIEASGVARICAALIGNLRVQEPDGGEHLLRASEIALLAPSKTQLPRYEKALDDLGLPVVSQAGKGLFRRQETQDILALTRLLADANDTLAFGAFLRGPLIGLTEQVLLDITAALPPDPTYPDEPSRFSLRTDPAHVSHLVARETLVILKDLKQKARSTTPSLLLSEAVERLKLRAILALREPHTGGRAIANLEMIIERAKPYGVSGLKSFARDMTRDWGELTDAEEGHLDAESDAINIITLHSAKGLEWPVIIPINMVTGPRQTDRFVYRMSTDTIHMVLGKVVPPDLATALVEDDDKARLEKERLWYVTCTRAMELLIVPDIPAAGAASWARIVDLKGNSLTAIELSHLTRQARKRRAEEPNHQTLEVFEAERAKLAVATKQIIWRRPSMDDDDLAPVADVLVDEPGDSPEAVHAIGGGRVRGTLLHKLMEEVLTGEVEDNATMLESRAEVLLASLATESQAMTRPSCAEMANTVRRTLELPEIAEMRPNLITEWPVYALLARNAQATPLAGRLDAATIVNGKIEVVLDWKSDIDPSEREMSRHAGQLAAYLAATGARRGALVYMTTGKIRWLRAP